MHVSGRPVTSFDPEGLIFAAGVDSEIIRLYDLRTFDRVSSICQLNSPSFCGGVTRWKDEGVA